MITLDKLIKSCLARIGTMKALSEYMGVHERTIYRWMSKEAKPSAESTIKMFNLLSTK